MVLSAIKAFKHKQEEEKRLVFSLTAQESDIDALVKKWVDENYGEFREGAKPNGVLLYRTRIFDRCKKYRDAPDGYLEIMLEKSLPDSIKWYFNIFQVVFMAGTISVSTGFFLLFLSNFFLFLTDVSVVSFVKWLIPIGLFAIIVVLALTTHEESESPRLSHFIQTKFKIIHNLKEIHIEMYYIAKVLETREKKKVNRHSGSK